jgi:hypothetical protein
MKRASSIGDDSGDGFELRLSVHQLIGAQLAAEFKGIARGGGEGLAMGSVRSRIRYATGYA